MIKAKQQLGELRADAKRQRLDRPDGKPLKKTVLNIWKGGKLSFKDVSDIGHAAGSAKHGLRLSKPDNKGRNHARTITRSLKITKKILKLSWFS